MAKRRFFKKNRKRRVFRRFKRRGARYPMTTKVLGIGPFPPRMITKLRYCDRITVNLTGGVMNDYVFNVNAMFDPDQTGGGHQPYGRDVYAGIYNRYRVFAVSYRITFYNNIGANNLTNVVHFNNAQTSLTGTNLSLFEEYPRAIVRYSTSTAVKPQVIKGHIKLNRINGVTSQQYRSDDRFQALVSSNPTETICMHIGNFDSNGGTGLFFNVQLMFHTEWFDPLNLAQS